MHRPMPQILVVDDEWTIRQQLSRAFELAGIPCECAVNGDEALASFLNHQHRLVVTDLRMPRKNGHSLALALLDQTNPPIVVALTGVTEPRLAQDLLHRGVADVVYKPLDYFRLVDRLKSLLVSAPAPTKVSQAALTQSAEESGKPQCRNRSELEQLFTNLAPSHPWLMTAMQWLDWERVPDPPAEMQEVVRQLTGNPSHVPSSGRRDGRIDCRERAVALELDREFNPAGKPFKVILRDMSCDGVGFVHTEWLATDLVAISWRGTRRNRLVIVARTLRCQPVGSFFDIAAMIPRDCAMTVQRNT